LAEAIKAFGGGVIMISHNKEFYGALCTEEWFLEGGGLRVEGKVDELVSGLRTHNKQARHASKRARPLGGVWVVFQRCFFFL
jgi:ATPase subunit of ABC transporter with duplicated ATPase domains